MEYHERLGHLAVRLLALNDLIPSKLAKCQEFKCPGCLYGKATRRPWRTKGKTGKKHLKRATQPGEVVSVEQLESNTMAKVAIGAASVVLFILCWCLLWTLLSYHFCRDVLLALKGNDSRTNSRRGLLKFFLVFSLGLSVLQVARLWQIFIIACEELAKEALL